MSKPFDPNLKLVKMPNAKEQPGPGEPKVIPDVEPPTEEIVESPTPESVQVMQKLTDARKDFKNIMVDFNKLFKSQILNDNKSKSDKDDEKEVINNLLRYSSEVDRFTDNEGTMGLIVLCLRHLLSLRDAGNDLSYKIYLLEKEVFGESTEDKKKKASLLEKQKKLVELQEALQKELDEFGE